MPESWAASGAVCSPVQKVLHSPEYLGLSQPLRGWTRYNFRIRNHSWSGQLWLFGDQLYLRVPRPWSPEWPHTTKEQPTLNISGHLSLSKVSRKKTFGWFSQQSVQQQSVQFALLIILSLLPFNYTLVKLIEASFSLHFKQTKESSPHYHSSITFSHINFPLALSSNILTFTSLAIVLIFFHHFSCSLQDLFYYFMCSLRQNAEIEHFNTGKGVL